MPLRRQNILEVYQTRLSAIAVDGGFQTNAGEALYFGETPLLGPDDPKAGIAIVPGEEQVFIQGKKAFVRLPVAVQAIAAADLDQPWVTIEQLIADIKTAMELPDRLLGGLLSSYLERPSVRALPRDPGSTTIGASVTYMNVFQETWGAP